jgi:hypothetical protein
VPQVSTWPVTLRWYLLMRAPRTGRGLIRSPALSAMVWPGCGGRSLICHSVPLSGGGCGAGRAGRQVGRERLFSGLVRCGAAGPALWPGHPEVISELPVDGTPGVAGAARGHVVCLTEHGERLAVIVPAEFAQALEGC